MRKLLNTIYVTQEGIYLSRVGETIVFEKNNAKLLQLPVHNLEGIVFFSPATVTPQAMELCSSYKIHISFISYTGKYLVKVQNPTSGNVRLRKIQYRYSDDLDESLRIAKNLCIGKIYNSRIVLLRLIRDHGENIERESVVSACDTMYATMRGISGVSSLQELLGKEGDAAKHYYGVFNQLIMSNEPGFTFFGRSRRPPLDNVNALLSYFYVMLSHEVESALETVGLDPQVGFFHQIRPGRASLALDVMEELRPYIVDRFVVSLINNKQVSQSDFIKKENGAVYLKDDSKAPLLQLWQKRKNEVVIHPFLKEKLEIGLIPYSQALLLARYIRGDIDEYPPFLMR